MNQKLDARAMGLSVGAVSAAVMLLLGVLGNAGVYSGAAKMMAEWHLFFTLSLAGIVGGMIEAFVEGFVLAYVTVLAYNTLILRGERSKLTSV